MWGLGFRFIRVPHKGFFGGLGFRSVRNLGFRVKVLGVQGCRVKL